MDLSSLDDRGLDLVLGGGLRWVRRVGDHAGAVLLIRGPAGSGKTLVGFNAALAIAKATAQPIAYACVELFPTELEAQIRSQRPDRTDVQVRYPGAEAKGPVADGDLVVEARVLDLREGPDALGEELARLWDALVAIGHQPGVLVIDSLIDGYGIGSSVGREFADAVCRLAGHWGIALILLEECAPATTSPWVYAADTVLELGVLNEDVDASRAAPFERRLTVLKHRYGPSDAGPHRFLLEPGRAVQVLPRPSAWLESWTARLSAGVPEARDHDGENRLEWQPESSARQKFPRALVVAVFGSVPQRVFKIAGEQKRQDGSDSPTLTVNFTRPLVDRPSASGPRADRVIGVAHPYLSAHRLVRIVLDEVSAIGDVRRVVLADLRALRSFWNADGLRRAVGVLCLLMRRKGVPVILIESTAGTMSVTGTPNGTQEFPEPGLDAPLSVDFADVAIEVRPRLAGIAPGAEYVTVVDLRTGATTSTA
jgi:KaiC/GvpD/RAD55 family RecA-like ATPase